MLRGFAQDLVLLTAVFALYSSSSGYAQSDDSSTRTPIKHVVVIFQENVSFDHYFGTYPNAVANKDGSSTSSPQKERLHA